MIRFMLVMVPVVFLINGFSKGNWTEAFLFAMAVAVGLTPEMLPMIVTINLAKGAIAMARKKVIVKRLNAIQNFGAIDVLCIDKDRHADPGQGHPGTACGHPRHECDSVLEYAYLNSHYQSGLKNLLDVAVLQHVGSGGAYHHILICMGAEEEVFSACRHAQSDSGEVFPVDAEHLVKLQEVTRDLNEYGFRVIAVAYKEIRQI